MKASFICLPSFSASVSVGREGPRIVRTRPPAPFKRRVPCHVGSPFAFLGPSCTSIVGSSPFDGSKTFTAPRRKSSSGGGLCRLPDGDRRFGDPRRSSRRSLERSRPRLSSRSLERSRRRSSGGGLWRLPDGERRREGTRRSSERSRPRRSSWRSKERSRRRSSWRPFERSRPPLAPERERERLFPPWLRPPRRSSRVSRARLSLERRGTRPRLRLPLMLRLKIGIGCA
mmetsp:Transcript_66962/g.186965  ORF Transcript_66962/g.186965 Transcript_66962/m.186965 type:complete len:229 (+) Transcript_66962:171-857(+)